MVNCVAKLEIFSSLLADCHFETILEARFVDIDDVVKNVCAFCHFTFLPFFKYICEASDVDMI